MFAVPGWSVDSKLLKVQNVEVSEHKEGLVGTQPSKKRKRDHGQKHVEVNSKNLGELWEKVIEGKSSSHDVMRSKRQRKRQKAATGSDASITVTGTELSLGEGGKENESKKDRRRRDASETKHGSMKGPQANAEEGSSKKKQKRPKIHEQQGDQLTELEGSPAANTEGKVQVVKQDQGPKLTPLQASMRQKLISARFRHINQTLYTTPSSKAFDLFQDSPEMFQEYHEGFRKQVEVWPENPVDGYHAQITQRGKLRGHSEGKKAAPTPLPRTAGTCHIADLGCGDATLAQNLQRDKKKLHIEIQSFDLQSPRRLVTKADIAALPLEDGSVDIAVFCLALMGTNWVDFIEEAFRILRWKGELWIAETRSRFGRPKKAGSGRVEHSVGKRKKTNQSEIMRMEGQGEERDLMVEVDGVEMKGADVDVSAFVDVLRKRGFLLMGDVETGNKMFVKMAFVKGATPAKGKGVKQLSEQGSEMKKKPKLKFLAEEADENVNEASVLKPCVYKLR